MSVDAREAVRWFANEMEKKLIANDYKGGWENSDQFQLFNKLRQEECSELLEAMIDSKLPVDPTALENIIEEAADVANLAMMIADLARKEILRQND